jgi:hypothetical protein
LFKYRTNGIESGQRLSRKIGKFDEKAGNEEGYFLKPGAHSRRAVLISRHAPVERSDILNRQRIVVGIAIRTVMLKLIIDFDEL